MFKDSPFLSMFTQLTIIFFLFSQPITVASHLSFCSFALSVWLVSWYVYSIRKSLFTEHNRIALVFFNSLYHSFLCQNLY